MEVGRALRRGLVAGAAGTLALNAVTYLDMAVRGRPASSVPADAAQRLAEGLGVDLGGDAETVAARREGLGALLGFASGLGLGAGYGVFVRRSGRIPIAVGTAGLTVVAMVGANGPATMADLTDPREWGIEGWLEDIAPHVLYGLVTATVHDSISRPARTMATVRSRNTVSRWTNR